MLPSRGSHVNVQRPPWYVIAFAIFWLTYLLVG
jgi:hypothetical protein